MEAAEIQSLMRPPVFILGCMKTGTTLTLSLLDAHPELLIMPSEMNYFRYSDHPSLFPKRKISNFPAGPQLTRRIVDALYFINLLDSRRLERLKAQYRLRPYDHHDFTAVDHRAFEEFVESALPHPSHREQFLHFFRALLVSTGQAPNSLAQRSIVEKSPLQEEHAPLLRTWFPSAKFVHIVRNPYATLCALRIVGSGALARGQRPRYPYLRDACSMIGASVRIGELNRSSIPNYLMVRYEDLVLEPEKTLGIICDFIGISFQECLLTPTLLGKPWGGNSMHGLASSGIESVAVERWKEKITALEIDLVNKKLGHILDTFGYARMPSRSRLRTMAPQSREGILTWVANRTFLQEPGEY